MSSVEAATPPLNIEARSGLNAPTEIQSQPLTVCLAGAPNAGKTALMNALTGGSFHTANYPGVTVTLSRGKSKAEFGPQVLLVDLPGVHSTSATSPEEDLSCRVIEGRHDSVKPDVLVVAVDATQLERHLKLASFVVRQKRPAVIALTMMDLLPRTHQTVNVRRLEAAIGVPVIAVDGRTGWGAAELMSAVYREANNSVRGESRLAKLPEDPVLAYAEIRSLLTASEALRNKNFLVLADDSFTAQIDKIVLHRVFGFPIFFAVLIGLFSSIFWAARPFMDLIDWSFSKTSHILLAILPEGPISHFLAEGVVGGVGAVAVFFPQIVILFFLMTLLEDSGYLARGAALVDRPLSYLGLHGRSFVPMLSGFACAIPAVLAARTIPARRERLLTIWILPLMSCSARLPVYALLLGAVLPGAAWKAGVSLGIIYVSSLLIGSLVAGLISRLFLPRRSVSLLAMEMPIYRKPLVKPTLRITWSRSSAYLRKAGVPIVVISAALWLLSNFGLGSNQPAPAEGFKAPLVATSDLDHSFAGQLGQTLEPGLRPMGVDWRVGVGLISAFAAREVFVSTMAIVFHVAQDPNDQQNGLLENMRTATFSGNSQRVFTTSSTLGLIVFFFFSLQCLSTVSVVRSETNSWRMALLQLLFYTGIGYLLSSALVTGLRFLGID